MSWEAIKNWFTDRFDPEQVLFVGISLLVILVVTLIVQFIALKLLKKVAERIKKKTQPEDVPAETHDRTDKLLKTTRKAVSIVIWIAALAAIFQVLGVAVGPIVVSVAGRILVAVILAIIAQQVISILIGRLEFYLIKRDQIEGEPPSESAKRIGTLIKLIRRGAYATLWVITAVVILGQLEIEIAPILAGAGIVGLAVGFGAQNLVRDIISGFFIILENQIRVGDVAIINSTGGLVEQINFRTTVLRDLSGVVHVFPNGTITTLANMTNEWSAHVFNIGVAYKENTDEVTEVIKQIIAEMREDATYGPLIIEEEIFGLDSFGDSAVVIKGRIKTKPIRQWMVGREFNRRIKLAFDEKGIEIPFPHRSIYFGEASKPFDIEMLSRAKENPAE